MFVVMVVVAPAVMVESVAPRNGRESAGSTRVVDVAAGFGLSKTILVADGALLGAVAERTCVLKLETEYTRTVVGY